MSREANEKVRKKLKHRAPLNIMPQNNKSDTKKPYPKFATVNVVKLFSQNKERSWHKVSYINQWVIEY